LPGGPIFVNVGTIQSADNEAELVGVIAHEMSHVYMQHSAKQAPKQEWANIIGALGGLFGGSAVGNLARLGIQLQTVKNMLSALYAKLGVSTRLQLVLLALRTGFVV